MKSVIKAGLAASALALFLTGCVYEPYGYVRGDGYYGDAYYGTTTYYYDSPGYYYSPGYYDPYYYGYGYGWYPSIGVGLYYNDWDRHHHRWQDGGGRNWSRGTYHSSHRVAPAARR